MNLIPTFSGKFSEWITFRDAVKGEVLQHEDIPEHLKRGIIAGKIMEAGPKGRWANAIANKDSAALAMFEMV